MNPDKGGIGDLLPRSAVGRIAVPSKWPQKPFASIASWKRTEKITQLTPLASSLGIEDGRESEREVVVTDMVQSAGPITCKNSYTKAQRLVDKRLSNILITYLYES